MAKIKSWFSEHFEETIMVSIGICGFVAGYILGHDRGYADLANQIMDATPDGEPIYF